MKTPAIGEVKATAYTIPTETPEADGTLEWNQTTLVLVEVKAEGLSGLGYTYGDASIATFIQRSLADLLQKRNPLDIPGCHQILLRHIRNQGRPGLVAMALSAIDVALWDLKAKLFNVPLATLFGQCRESVLFYGSGGFTSYSISKLQHQLKKWADGRMAFVKMKIGSHPEKDIERVRAAKEAIGDTELFVDANGAYDPKQALEFANEFYRIGVRWFEEPVSSDDLEGLRFIRQRGPAGIHIAAGEYGFDLFYFKRMIDAGAVDILQIDTTRCGGYTIFLKAAALAEAAGIPISAHCAPTLHTPLGTALPHMKHVEYFFDHARIEQMLFDGAIVADKGVGRPDLKRPGLGLSFKRKEAARYAVA